MSSSPDAIQGKVILHVRLRAKPGKVDKLIAAFLKVKESVEGPNEPDGIAFRVAHFGDEILLFEEYNNTAALGPHAETEAFKALQEIMPECRDGEPTVLFYEEAGLP